MKRGPKPRLTLEQIEQIRRLVCSGKLSQKEAACEFGVTVSHISRIKNGFMPK
jgi:transcriptional regulator with XRE-family HTH domain